MALLVNGERIEDAAIKQEVERLRPDYEKAFVDMDPKEREAQLLDWCKENVIERTLLIQEIKSKGSAVPKKQVEYVYTRLKEKYCKDKQEPHKEFGAESEEKLKELIEMLLKTTSKFDEISKDLPKPTQADIEKYYQENKELFRTADKVRVAHIVKYIDWQTDETAAYNAIRQAQEEINNGTPFETAIEQYTDDPDSGNNSDYITQGEKAEEFEDIVFNLDAGEISDIFHTRYGFHIAKVYDKKPGTIPSLKEIKNQIIDVLTENMRQAAVEKFIDQLKNKARIEESI